MSLWRTRSAEQHDNHSTARGEIGIIEGYTLKGPDVCINVTITGPGPVETPEGMCVLRYLWEPTEPGRKSIASVVPISPGSLGDATTHMAPELEARAEQAAIAVLKEP